MRPGGPRTFGNTFRQPAKDSPRARANATFFLVNCLRLESVTVDEIAGRYRLSPKVAEYLLIQETQRRAAA